MAARAALQSLLEDDAELSNIGVTAVYPTNSVDTPPDELFLIVRWDPTNRVFGNRGQDRVQIWVHDKSKDYGRISLCLARLRELLPAVVHRAGADGWTLSTAEWAGEGPDLYDDGYGTVTRFADFVLVSRYTASG
jgi:hypothetical protein